MQTCEPHRKCKNQMIGNEGTPQATEKGRSDPHSRVQDGVRDQCICQKKTEEVVDMKQTTVIPNVDHSSVIITS